MAISSPEMYEFDGFRFDADAVILYRNGEVVKAAERHSLQVLASILAGAERFASYEEIIDAVWPGVEYGVDPARVNQHISKLRRLFAQYELDKEYFENLRGRGYRFLCPITEPAEIPGSRDPFRGTGPQGDDLNYQKAPVSSSRKKHYVAAGLIALLVLIGLAFWKWQPIDDELEVRRVVKESQLYESMVLYKNPQAFQETDLDKYWTNEIDGSMNFDRGRIRQSVEKLLAENRKYGDETKYERFDFQSVEINTTRDQATARVLEKWQVANYSFDNTLLQIKPVGPYFVDYFLRKVDGQWFVEKSTTARTTRPTPSLEAVTPVSQPVAGKEFLVNVTGTDLEPMTIYIEVIGKDCPSVRPCKIPNKVLLEHSRLSEKLIEAIPMTLASGEFTIIARNGDSKPSNPINLTVR